MTSMDGPGVECKSIRVTTVVEEWFENGIARIKGRKPNIRKKHVVTFDLGKPEMRDMAMSCGFATE